MPCKLQLFQEVTSDACNQAAQDQNVVLTRRLAIMENSFIFRFKALFTIWEIPGLAPIN